jgi:hypothetical protein
MTPKGTIPPQRSSISTPPLPPPLPLPLPPIQPREPQTDLQSSVLSPKSSENGDPDENGVFNESEDQDQEHDDDDNDDEQEGNAKAPEVTIAKIVTTAELPQIRHRTRCLYERKAILAEKEALCKEGLCAKREMNCVL